MLAIPFYERGHKSMAVPKSPLLKRRTKIVATVGPASNNPNVIERLIGWLKESRRVFSRFEKTAVNYLGMIHVACIRYYLAELCAK